jgi:hypothetical protein
MVGLLAAAIAIPITAESENHFHKYLKISLQEGINFVKSICENG